MMKMHGLGDNAYWIIQYSWFLFIYCVYIAVLLLVGSAINLKFFRLTSYGLQILFFFVWGNCLIACAFLASVFFRSAKTANVVAFLWVFGTGLLNNLLMENYYKDQHSWVYIVELIPSFALYRCLYEQVWKDLCLQSGCMHAVMPTSYAAPIMLLKVAHCNWCLQQLDDMPPQCLLCMTWQCAGMQMLTFALQAAYAFRATYQNGGHGMNFTNIHDYNNHWIYAISICTVEAALALPLAWYLEQVLPSGTGKQCLLVNSTQDSLLQIC